jgi:H/ACA ribonucleoprotein complex non-core subunit NAF1
MSDSLGPPAKRARLEGDAPSYGAAATALDAPGSPGSPVDDMDDDFYDTTPVEPSAQPAVDGPTSSLFAAAPPAPAPFHLPGLGSLSEVPVAQQQQQPIPPQNSAIAQNEASEEGELSDDGEAFYNDATAQASIQPAANEGQAQDEAPQHGKPCVSVYDMKPLTSYLTIKDVVLSVDTEAAEADGDLESVLTAAINLQNSFDRIAGDDKAEFLRAAEANQGDKNAEWALDSDATDSDSDSSDSSSDSSSDEGELLDPAEQVRLLMAEAADSPGASGPVKIKTLNEQEEKYEKPDITVTEATKISELGNVESIVGNVVVVKAKRSGNDEVLESGSALCLQDRTVIGKVSEQIGRVEEPRYSFGSNDVDELTTLGIKKGTTIYYVEEHSTWVETEPIRRQKHTDASNLHDEEAHDVDFSDDEKEAEHKRAQKEKKKRRRSGDNGELAMMNIPTGPRLHVDAPAPPIYRPMEYQGGGLKYSDDDDDDMGMYTPLARPDHFEQIVGRGAPLEDRSHVRRGMGRGRGPWGDRGRGFRGRGAAGGRGDFGGGRGDRGGYGGGRGDFAGGRGDRQGQRGDRGGQNNRGGGDRGGRGGKNQNQNQSDRGRQQDQFNDRNHDRQQNNQQRGGYQDQRSATSASPARQQQDRGHSYGQQDRGQSQQSSNQQSPPLKNKNRKQRQREKRERERLDQQNQQNQQQQRQRTPNQSHASPAPSAPSNANAYANNSSAGWPAPFPGPSQPAIPYAAAPAPPPPAAAASYAPQPAYTPQPSVPAQPPQQQDHAANLAAWAQWFQVVGAMSGQQPAQPQMQAPAPAPAPPQPQSQAQYAYPYQQYAQQYAQPAAPANPPQQQQQQQQGNAQAAAPSLQDILRALSGGGAPQ